MTGNHGCLSTPPGRSGISRRAFTRAALNIGAALGLAPLAGSLGTPRAALATEQGAPDIFNVAPVLGPASLEVGETFHYANVALQLATVGVEPPYDVTTATEDAVSAWIGAIRNLPFPGTIGRYLLVPDWRELHGFATSQVDQAIQVGTPPNMATVVRGRFDLEEIRVALRAGGYQAAEIADTDGFRIRADGEVDLTDPISRFWLAQANTIALLDDTTLGFASSGALMERVIGAATGDGSALADQVEIAALFPTDEPELAGAIGVTGGTLVSVGDPSMILDPEMTVEAFATAEAERAGAAVLPPIRQAVFGATPGGPVGPSSDEPPTLDSSEVVAQAHIRALFLDRAAADAAVPVIRDRLDTGQSVRGGMSWSQVLEDWEVEAVGDEGLVVIRVGLPGQLVSRIYHLYPARDVGFLSWP